MDPFETPDFSIERLGPAHVPSPLAEMYGSAISFFVGDDERTLYDTTGFSWHHNQMPFAIDCVNLEVAGPRRFIFFNPAETRAAIVTCGGLCPGINNVIRGLTHSLCLQYRIKQVLGIQYGYAGMVEGGHEPIELTPNYVEPVHLQGGSCLGSSRGPQPIEKMLEFLKKREINLLFTIGGDGTQRGALEIAKQAKETGANLAVIGVPKTIDNDLNYVDKSFGFETAFSIADEALRAAHAEAKGAFNGVSIVKLMGRHSGYITAVASLANGNVNFVLVPEVPFELEGPKGFLTVLENRLKRRGHAVVAVAEGAGQDLLEAEVDKLGHDASGNKRLADIGTFLKQQIEKQFKQRQVPVNVRYIDPSYMIRSAPATPNDSVFCLQLAHHAAHAAMSGRTGMIVGIWKNTFTHVPLKEIVKEKKHLDPNGSLWISVLQATGQPMHMVNQKKEPELAPEI
jgi:6-phosphofructokinase 1